MYWKLSLGKRAELRFFPLSLSVFFDCSLYLLPSAPSPIHSFMPLPVTIRISFMEFFIPAVQLHILALTPLRLFVAKAREWCLSYSTSIKLAVIRQTVTCCHPSIVCSMGSHCTCSFFIILFPPPPCLRLSMSLHLRMAYISTAVKRCEYAV